MATLLNISEFEILKDVNGVVIQELDSVFLRHICKGDVVKVPFEVAADYFKLARVAVRREPLRQNSLEPEASTSTKDIINTKTVVAWTEEQSKIMLTLYKDNMDCVGPLKKLKNKKQMWEKISEELSNKFGIPFTSTQVENRFKNISKKNKIRVKHNRTSGNTKMETLYDREMDRIGALDDSMEPEIIMTPTCIIRKKAISECTDDSMDFPVSNEEAIQTSSKSAANNASPSPMTDTESSSIPRQRRRQMTTFQEELLDTYKKTCEDKKLQRERHEQQKQKRHEDKMKGMSDLTNAILTLVRNTQKP